MSLFCGSCNVEAKVKGFDRYIINDKHYYLIALLRAVADGYELPDYISEEKYRRIRANKDDDPALSGFAGFGCSFGGKWFAGYARGKTRNYALTAKKSMLQIKPFLQSAEILNLDYRDVPIPPCSVVYCDPPYANTTTYKGVDKFDTVAFWDYMRKLSRDGHKVFISEQSAPDDFECVWEKPVKRSINNFKPQLLKTEKLFVYEKENTQ